MRVHTCLTSDILWPFRLFSPSLLVSPWSPIYKMEAELKALKPLQPIFKIPHVEICMEGPVLQTSHSYKGLRVRWMAYCKQSEVRGSHVPGPHCLGDQVWLSACD